LVQGRIETIHLFLTHFSNGFGGVKTFPTHDDPPFPAFDQLRLGHILREFKFIAHDLGSEPGAGTEVEAVADSLGEDDATGLVQRDGSGHGSEYTILNARNNAIGILGNRRLWVIISRTIPLFRA
jgi:hypothetical protein